MIPNGVYVLLGFLVLVTGVEFFLLLYKFKKDEQINISKGFFGGDSIESTPTAASGSSFFTDSSDTSAASPFQIEKELVKDVIEARPFGTSFFYFIMAAACLIVIGVAIRIIFGA